MCIHFYSKSPGSSQYKKATNFTTIELGKGVVKKLRFSLTTSLARNSLYVRKVITINYIERCSLLMLLGYSKNTLEKFSQLDCFILIFF